MVNTETVNVGNKLIILDESMKFINNHQQNQWCHTENKGILSKCLLPPEMFLFKQTKKKYLFLVTNWKNLMSNDLKETVLFNEFTEKLHSKECGSET